MDAGISSSRDGYGGSMLRDSAPWREREWREREPYLRERELDYRDSEWRDRMRRDREWRDRVPLERGWLDRERRDAPWHDAQWRDASRRDAPWRDASWRDRERLEHRDEGEYGGATRALSSDGALSVPERGDTMRGDGRGERRPSYGMVSPHAEGRGDADERAEELGELRSGAFGEGRGDARPAGSSANASVDGAAACSVAGVGDDADGLVSGGDGGSGAGGSGGGDGGGNGGNDGAASGGGGSAVGGDDSAGGDGGAFGESGGVAPDGVGGCGEGAEDGEVEVDDASAGGTPGVMSVVVDDLTEAWMEEEYVQQLFVKWGETPVRCRVAREWQEGSRPSKGYAVVQFRSVYAAVCCLSPAAERALAAALSHHTQLPRSAAALSRRAQPPHSQLATPTAAPPLATHSPPLALDRAAEARAPKDGRQAAGALWPPLRPAPRQDRVLGLRGRSDDGAS